MQNIRQKVVAGEDPKQEETEGFEGLFANDVASICPLPNVPVSCTATTKEQAERMDTEQRHMVSHSASVVRQPASLASQLVKESHRLTKIDPKDIVLLGKTIGRGTFGTCQLADYRSVTVVLKRFTEISGKECSFERQKKKS